MKGREERVEFERGRRSLEEISLDYGGGFTWLLRQARTLVPSDSRFILREVLERIRYLWCQRARLLYCTGEGESDFRDEADEVLLILWTPTRARDEICACSVRNGSVAEVWVTSSLANESVKICAGFSIGIWLRYG
ncbi:hypothetical protein MA16_Dca021248 [Dendrobium catenatum]|uniref:Uncharacterized protein n=1 Tax=Dendrobium catenatum TaxID=906689 RepID=A0A2I0VV61_9ASPA|nr:hypothetical protein MA16_Dca021248 [Dendrobium catenatum]